MTPFIMDVACVNGNFVSLTCFAEAWLRNANGGAVAMYASSINQSWNSPMRAEDECTDLLIAESKTTTGGLYYNASCKMMDVYGNTAGSDGVNMFKTWHIFGDASLQVRSKTPLAMSVTHPSQIVAGATSLSVSTGVANALVAVTYNNTIYARGYANSSGSATLTLVGAPSTALTYTITATAFNRVTYVGSIQQVTGLVISITPVSFTETLAPGASTTRNITINNTGSAALNWTITSSQLPSWASVAPTSGSVAAGGNAVLTLTLNAAGLAESTYNATVTVNSNATNSPTINIPLTLTVYYPYPTGPRFVAEWETAKGALIRFPFGLQYPMIANLSQNDLLYVLVPAANQTSANNLLTANGVNMANVRYINAESDSYQIRDYGPWYLFESDNSLNIIDFTYNHPQPLDDAAPTVVANYLGIPHFDMPIIHSGGNIMTDGMGKAMSTQLAVTQNSPLTQAQVSDMFSNYLGITDYQYYTDPNTGPEDHIDCWAKLLDADKVLIRSVPTSHPQYAAIEAVVAQWQTRTSSLGTPYRIFRVSTPGDEPYTNAFILNHKIYVPQMNTANDAAALTAYQNAMPGYTVLGYSFSSFSATDAIHSRVTAVFDEQMVALRHLRPASATALQNVTLNVNIQHSNAMNPSQTYVAWKHSLTADWNYTSLTFVSGTSWTASIPSPALGQTIYYWFKGTDLTGRSTSLPLCGGSDPYTLLVNIPAPNSPPVLNLPVNFSLDKNSSLSVDFSAYATDPDNNPLTLSVCNCTSMSIQINGLLVTFNPVQNFVGSETATFNVSDGIVNATDSVNVIVNQILMPPWTPVSEPAFATLHGVVSLESLPANLNDVVGAFVGEECHGVGEVRTQNGLAYVDMSVNLAGAREMVSFRIYDFSTGTYYPVLQELALSPGVEYGLVTPVPINGTLNIVLAQPNPSVSTANGNTILNWNPVTYALEYKVYRTFDLTQPYDLIGTVTGTQFTDTALSAHAFYYVKAVRNLPFSSESRD
jgi:agmatine/peptidylarginine deiminase